MFPPWVHKLQCEQKIWPPPTPRQAGQHMQHGQHGQHMQHGQQGQHRQYMQHGQRALPSPARVNPPTSLICCSLSSRLSMVSCSCFSFSSREISSAAKAAGSTGVISLGRRWVLYKEQGHKVQGMFSGRHGVLSRSGIAGPATLVVSPCLDEKTTATRHGLLWIFMS